MTLEEAISKLKNTPVDVLVGKPLEFALAKRLGIEALEKELNFRKCHKVLHPADYCPLPLLPSETEE